MENGREASRVPAPVKEQVQKQYPNAGAIEWDFDNDEDVYEAEFHLNGLEYEVKLYPDGTVSLVKADISLQHLPAPVTAAIARDFPGYALRRARQITARGVLKYRVKPGDSLRRLTRHPLDSTKPDDIRSNLQ